MKTKEKILRIEEATFKIKENDWHTFIGYQVITDQQTIKVGISNNRLCCENFGYLITNDDTEDFIGADLINISIVDTALNNKKLEQIEYLDYGSAMFVNFETSNGLLQLVVYNSHNGYYGHETVLISKQLNHEGGL